MTICVGTAGYSYKDWRGAFYPEGIKDSGLLEYYSTRFNMVELDFTYYHLPSSRTLQAIERKTPAGFTFLVKAYKGMTHELPPSAEREAVFHAFREAVRPLDEAGKLGCVLLQYPFGFKPLSQTASHWQWSVDRLKPWPVAVEFRNSAWLTADTFAALRAAGAGFCAVDEPRLPGLVPPVAVSTGPPAYVRFHGRNAAKWWKHKEAWERYDYLYSREELEAWVPKVRGLEAETGTAYVVFNNCHAGQAASNALLMRELLG